MATVWAHCKAKMVCEPDEAEKEGERDGDEPKKGHGGCGHNQPQIRKEGLKLFVQYKKSKDDDEVRLRGGTVDETPTPALGGQVSAARQAALLGVGSLHHVQEDV
jgi:DNA-directed RNA polymerase II subunit RPB1